MWPCCTGCSSRPLWSCCTGGAGVALWSLRSGGARSSLRTYQRNAAAPCAAGLRSEERVAGGVDVEVSICTSAPGWVTRTVQHRAAICACGTLWSRCSLWSLRTGGARCPSWTCWPLRTGRSRCSGIALWSLRSGGARSARCSLRTYQRNAAPPCAAGFRTEERVAAGVDIEVSIRADATSRVAGSIEHGAAIGTCCTLRTRGACCPLRPRRTLWPRRACRSRWSLRTLRSCRSLYGAYVLPIARGLTPYIETAPDEIGVTRVSGRRKLIHIGECAEDRDAGTISTCGTLRPRGSRRSLRALRSLWSSGSGCTGGARCTLWPGNALRALRSDQRCAAAPRSCCLRSKERIGGCVDVEVAVRSCSSCGVARSVQDRASIRTSCALRPCRALDGSHVLPRVRVITPNVKASVHQVCIAWVT